ncbi:unnamed protein product [Boreogadus saida]
MATPELPEGRREPRRQVTSAARGPASTEAGLLAPRGTSGGGGSQLDTLLLSRRSWPLERRQRQRSTGPGADAALLNLSADLLSGPCLPRWGPDRLRTVSCSGGLLGLAPVFLEGPQEEEVERGGGRRAPWELRPPLGLRGSERQAARALASLPRPGPPPWLQGGGCRRCVVVGSGGVLHGSHLGSSIDQYDVIIRLNAAPLGGFQRDAGSRTTIRLVYPEAAPASPEEYRTTSLVALVVFKSLDLDWLTSVITKRPLSFWSKLWFWRTVVEEIPLTAEHFRILNPEIVHQTGRALHSYTPGGGTRVPTLGASAVVLALQLCDQVSLAGFGYDLRHPGARLHYYEALRMEAMKGQVGDLSMEAMKGQVRDLSMEAMKGQVGDPTHGGHEGPGRRPYTWRP